MQLIYTRWWWVQLNVEKSCLLKAVAIISEDSLSPASVCTCDLEMINSAPGIFSHLYCQATLYYTGNGTNIGVQLHSSCIKVRKNLSDWIGLYWVRSCNKSYSTCQEMFNVMDVKFLWQLKEERSVLPVSWLVFSHSNRLTGYSSCHCLSDVSWVECLPTWFK